MRSFLQLMALISLLSCSGQPPYQERKVKIWNGAPEEAGICRMSTQNLKSASGIQTPLFLMKKIHQGTTNYECMKAKDPAFEKYACLTFEDLGVLYAYIETLIYSCKEWE
jgi:hypothetical protein